MTRGLVIGKFMPVHKGHLALIHFAAGRCDELIVSMSFTETDPIDGDLRFEWLKSLLSDNHKIKVAKLKDDFDKENESWSFRTKIWADVIRKTYPPIDIIFSSEEYGPPFGANLGAAHIFFDPSRTIIPVSATVIRQDPFQYWQFIPEAVRPYFVKKICFYGPESTGKSVMAKKMADLFQTEFVPEVAREMITSNEFTVQQIISIGTAQTERVLKKAKTANKLLFCDTDLITTQIYSKHYLGVVPEILLNMEKQVRYDQYFLFDTDVPWEADGLRDLGNFRKEMFETFKHELEKRKLPYMLVQGNFEERERFVSSKLRKLFSL